MLLFSCGQTKKSNGKIIAYKYGHGFNYELQLPYHVVGRGNVHQLNFKRYEYDDADWIYIDSLKGRKNADAFVFTFYQRKTEYPWNNSNIMGHIDFINDTTVILDLRFYDSTVMKLGNVYWFNGTYKLEVRQDSAALIEKDY
jgi:hypothetical protein